MAIVGISTVAIVVDVVFPIFTKIVFMILFDVGLGELIDLLAHVGDFVTGIISIHSRVRL
jgi:hypothetical protein